MIKYQELTIIIPTKNRSAYINSLIEYYNEINFDSTMIIADSSDEVNFQKIEDKNIGLDDDPSTLNASVEEKNDTVYINLKALDKITAKTSSLRMAIGDKKFFGQLEIRALKCELSEENDAQE